MRDIFGRLQLDPAKLDLRGRVDCLRRLGGELQAGDSAEARWLGRRLLAWLVGDAANLEDALGLRVRRGSRSTVQAILRAERRDDALLALAGVLGSDLAAVRVLRGGPCPPAHQHLADEAQRLGCPASRSAIRRARASLHHR